MSVVQGMSDLLLDSTAGLRTRADCRLGCSVDRRTSDDCLSETQCRVQRLDVVLCEERAVHLGQRLRL